VSQLVRLDDRSKLLNTLFSSNMNAMAKMVPRTMGDPNRLLRIAYNNVAYNTDLLECLATPSGTASVFGGVMEALKLGLTIGGPMQESWLIPFKNKGTKEAVLIIGYQGFRNILDRGKSVIDLHPVAVYQNDEFEFELGSRPFVKHKPMLGGDRGPLIAVYAVAHLPRGGIQIEVMGKDEIDQHRAKSRARENGPWVDFYEAMALKTVVRKIAKYLPKSSEILARALDLDDRADRGVDQAFDIEGLVLDITTPGPMKQVGGTGLDRLTASLGAGAPSKAKAEGDGDGGTTEDIREQNEGRSAQEETDSEQDRITREREEIARKVKEFEAQGAGRQAPSRAEVVPTTQGMTPLTQALFETPSEVNQPIGEARAKELLAGIRANTGGKK
jgi:recombination protein RecT